MVAYLERALWRQLFKLIHLQKGMAYVAPSRMVIASCLIFEKIHFPNALSEVGREFVRNPLNSVHAINRVPYESYEKGLLAFYELELQVFNKVVEHFTQLELLDEFDEGNCYTQSISLGSGKPFVVNETGSFVPKKFFWHEKSQYYQENLDLYIEHIRTDPDVIDNCNGFVDSIIDTEVAKRLDFLDGCFRVSKKNQGVPIVRNIDTLLPMLEDFFPKHSFTLNLFRLLTSELLAFSFMDFSPTSLRELVNNSRIQTLRQEVYEISLGQKEWRYDPHDMCEKFKSVISDWIYINKGKSQDRYILNIPDRTWPNYSFDSLRSKSELIRDEDSKNKLILIIPRRLEDGRLAFLGVNTIFFDPY